MGLTENQNLKADDDTEFYKSNTWRCWVYSSVHVHNSLSAKSSLILLYLSFVLYATVHSVFQKQQNSIWNLFLLLVTLEDFFCNSSYWLNIAMITKSLWKVSHWRLNKIFNCNIFKLNFEISLPGETAFLKCSWQD